MDKEKIKFPFEVFPKEITYYIKEVARTQSFSEDFLAVAFMSAVATAIGNRMQYQTPKSSWVEKPIFWLAIVGNPSVGKTPALKAMLKPVQTLSNRYAKEYNILKRDYDALTPEQKKVTDKPTRKDFILPDATIEKMADIHSENEKGVLLFRDELISWVNSMGEYKSGKNTERQKYLDIYNGGTLQVDRMRSEKITFVEDTCMNVLGGIQESKLEGFLNQENQGDGFSARMLFAYPEPVIGFLIDEDVNAEDLKWYNESFDLLFDHLDKHSEVRTLTTSKEGRNSFFEYINMYISELTDEETPEHVKYVIGKKRTYLPRFALLLEIINYYFGDDSSDLENVSKKSLDDAFTLLDYFFTMNAKVNKVYTKHEEMDSTLNGKATKTDKAMKLINSKQFKDGEITQADISQKTGMNKGNLSKLIKKLAGNKSKFQ